jgi:hypothetical protein
MNRSFSVLLTAAALAACGGAQLNQTKLAEVQASLTAAEAVGAANQPQAELHLQLARDQLAQAQRVAEDGHEERAALLLERSRADADLALQLARTEEEREKAREAWTKVQDPKLNQR